MKRALVLTALLAIAAVGGALAYRATVRDRSYRALLADFGNQLGKKTRMDTNLRRLEAHGFIVRRGVDIAEGPLLDLLLDYDTLAPRILDGALADVLARSTDEFHSLRNYAPGDDLRRVHWKQSARTDDLKIKQTDPDAVRRLGVLLDVSAERYDPASFEAAVSAATSVALSADQAGWRVQGTTSGIGIRPTEDLEDFIETLALANVEPARPLTDAVHALARHYEGGLIVVVTGGSTGEAASSPCGCAREACV